MPDFLPATSARVSLTAIVLALAGVVAWELYRIPVQVSDSVGNLLQIQDQSLPHLFVDQFFNGSYLRPLLWVQIKAAYAIAPGHEQLMFRGIHVAQLLLLAVLFARLMRVATERDLVAAILGILVLFGMHTFDGMVREAFPINSFLTVALCALAATNLADGEPVWWRDATAIGLFCFAILTVESGILVFVAVVAGRMAGLKGISGRGVALTGLACVGYFVLRFGVLDVGSPGLGERSSGFGFQVLEPDQLTARFGSNPLPFYGYNVVASLASVLLSDPRGGVWYAVHSLSMGEMPAWMAVNITASLAATAIVLRASARSAARWFAGTADARARIVLVSLAILVANAFVSFGYAKDAIISTGGVYFALAVYAGTAMLLDEGRRRNGRRGLQAAVAVVLVLWSIRALALPYRLERQAAFVRAQWVNVYPELERLGITLRSSEGMALVERLRDDALRTRPPVVDSTGWHRILDLN